MAPIAATRLAAFESRAQFAPDQVLRHTTAGWRYIAIHPFADDHGRGRELAAVPLVATCQRAAS
jgi:hypothetical protein